MYSFAACLLPARSCERLRPLGTPGLRPQLLGDRVSVQGLCLWVSHWGQTGQAQLGLGGASGPASLTSCSWPGGPAPHMTFWGVAPRAESGTSIPRSLSLYGGGEAGRLATETHRDAAESWEGGRPRSCGPGRADLLRACRRPPRVSPAGRSAPLWPPSLLCLIARKPWATAGPRPWVSSNPELPQVCMRSRLGDPGTGRVLPRSSGGHDPLAPPR